MTRSSARTATQDYSALSFLRGMVASPRDVASIAPSSRVLLRRLSSLACVRSAKFIVELGPGTGGTTRALLNQMQPSARLLGVEIMEAFVKQLHQISDRRLDVVHGSAVDVLTHAACLGGTAPDVIISGIPFSTMSWNDGRSLVSAIHDSLAPGGTFIAYQLRNRVHGLAGDLFGKPQTSFVFWNLPPLWIYQWNKPLIERRTEAIEGPHASGHGRARGRKSHPAASAQQ
ncbi:MAG: methyltransferase [Planctomycetaceae bacterium]|nr:methyltransferase [Planctomycetaceae bacterium]